MQLAERSRATWVIALVSVAALVSAGFAARHWRHHRHHRQDRIEMMPDSWGHHGHGHRHMFERTGCMEMHMPMTHVDVGDSMPTTRGW